jgi:autotransporter-associated beta strand protein
MTKKLFPSPIKTAGGLTIASILLASQAATMAADWNTTTGLFSDPNSWNPVGVPTGSTAANILNGGTAQIVNGDNFGVGVFSIGGQTGVGTVTQSGGSITATQIILGGSDTNGSTGVGTYTMTGGTLAGNGADKELWIGSRGGTGNLTMSGSAAITNTGAWIVIGRDTGGVANVNMSGSSSIAQVGNGNFAIGVNTGTTSTVTMGGTSSISTGNELRVGFIGGAATTGVLNLNDSSSATSGGNLWVGLQSAGQMTLSNTATATGGIVIAGGDGGGNGTITVNDNATLTANQDLLVSWNGASGVFTQNGGNVVTHAFTGIDNTGASVTVNGANGVNGVVNLNGGTLSATGFNKPTNTATLNFNGTVVKVTGNTTTGSFINNFGNGEINVQAGGAKFDTNGNSITIVQDLSGVGGLTKQGAGSLTLTGASAYTGTTTITGGSLVLGASERISDSSNLELAGGALELNNFNETLGTLSLSSNSTIDFGNLVSANAIAFANSSGNAWTGVLTLTNFEPGSDTISFLGAGLTGAQLAKIQYTFNDTVFAGSGFNGDNVVFSAVPEPSSVALLGSAALACGFGVLRRRARLGAKIS